MYTYAGWCKRNVTFLCPSWTSLKRSRFYRIARQISIGADVGINILTWMSQKVSPRLVSGSYPQYTPFISRLHPSSNHLDIHSYPVARRKLALAKRSSLDRCAWMRYFWPGNSPQKKPNEFAPENSIGWKMIHFLFLKWSVFWDR